MASILNFLRKPASLAITGVTTGLCPRTGRVRA
jgi:hypothetical protein